jgi:P4 family phage/plasmid primase-like protien
MFAYNSNPLTGQDAFDRERGCFLTLCCVADLLKCISEQSAQVRNQTHRDVLRKLDHLVAWSGDDYDKANYMISAFRNVLVTEENGKFVSQVELKWQDTYPIPKGTKVNVWEISSSRTPPVSRPQDTSTTVEPECSRGLITCGSVPTSNKRKDVETPSSNPHLTPVDSRASGPCKKKRFLLEDEEPLEENEEKDETPLKDLLAKEGIVYHRLSDEDEPSGDPLEEDPLEKEDVSGEDEPLEKEDVSGEDEPLEKEDVSGEDEPSDAIKEFQKRLNIDMLVQKTIKVNPNCYVMELKDGRVLKLSPKKGLWVYTDKYDKEGATISNWRDVIDDALLENIFPRNQNAQRTKRHKYEINDFYEDDTAADIYVQGYGSENLKTMESKDRPAFEWDDDKLLWVRKTHKQILESITRFFKEAIRPLTRDTSLDKVQILQLNRRVKSSKFRDTIYWMIHTRCYEPEFEATVDKNPDALPIKKGMLVDLITGTQRLRTKQDRFSVELPVNLLDAKHPLTHMEKWTHDVFGSHLVHYMQKISGYFLTGRVTSNKIFVLWGDKRNGKGTFMTLLGDILGKFCGSVSKEVFIETEGRKTPGAASPHIAALQGLRVGFFSELKPGDTLSTLLKSLTGEDPIKYRELYVNEEKVLLPSLKPVICTNFKPDINPNDQAMVDRLLLIPFHYEFVDNPFRPNQKKKNPEVLRDLRQNHLDEVFTWCVRGSIEWYKDSNLSSSPEDVRSATDEHVRELDVVGRFLESTYNKVNDQSQRILCSDMYRLFGDWFNKEDLDTKKPGQSEFTNRAKQEFSYINPRNRLTFTSITLKPVVPAVAPNSISLMPGAYMRSI